MKIPLRDSLTPKHCRPGVATWLALLIVMAMPPAVRAADGPIQLRVMSYNIHHGEGVDGKIDLSRIARVINDARVDVVALQEVDSGVERTAGVDQPRELARLTGLAIVFGDNIAYQGGRYGNAVLSRFPVEECVNHPLPSHYEGEQRGVMRVVLKTPDGWPAVRVLATHFDYRQGSTERLDSAEVVNQLLRDTAPDARSLTLLVGDLNAQPGSPTLLRLAEQWRSASAAPAPTFPVDHPTRQIDHVLVGKSSRWQNESFEVLAEPTASDHRPIVATLRFAPQQLD
ncbi:endonuclease/exonuclease/phosphatase family protein [Posidoniimonas polymericola]|nr:endonuclease/exonuclease/phosphatase family protein [Posidoniimonas polymericola]